MLIFFWVNPGGGEPPPPTSMTRFEGLRRNVGLLLR